LSNTPSIPMNDTHESFASADEEMSFSSCNFCLKKRLDELASFKTKLQFGRAHQLIKSDPWRSFKDKEYDIDCKELSGHDIASNIAIGFLIVEQGQAEKGEFQGSKTKGELSRVVIGSTEPLRECHEGYTIRRTKGVEGFQLATHDTL
jgi:hypothetical protein